MVLPFAKLVASESVPTPPDNEVAPVIGAASLLLATLPVAVPAVLKKLSPAAIADAATSEVLASLPIAVLSAALRLVAVAVEFAPIAKLPAGGGVVLEAVKSICSVLPSGSVNWKLTASPLFGLVAPRSTEIAAGDPLGPVTVAPVNVEETALSFSPNGDPATSSATFTDVPLGWVSTSRPMPLVPRSGCLRSAMAVLSPAYVVVPFMIRSAVATDGVFNAVPENK